MEDGGSRVHLLNYKSSMLHSHADSCIEYCCSDLETESLGQHQILKELNNEVINVFYHKYYDKYLLDTSTVLYNNFFFTCIL